MSAAAEAVLSFGEALESCLVEATKAARLLSEYKTLVDHELSLHVHRELAGAQDYWLGR